MTVSVDYTQLDQPPIVLTLTPIPGGYMVSDQHGRPWTLAPVDLTFAVRFMAAAAEKAHALIDDASVERATWQPSSGEGPSRGHGRIAADPKAQGAAAAPVSLAAPHGEPAPSPDSFSVKVPTNVVPIR